MASGQNLRRRRPTLWAHRGQIVLAGYLDPADQVVRLVELQFAQDAPAEFGPLAIPIVVINHGLERAEADFEAASFVAEDMAPAADLGGLAVTGTAEATRASAAQNKNAR